MKLFALSVFFIFTSIAMANPYTKAKNLQKPLLVMFSAEWCAPCREATKLIEENLLTKVEFTKIDRDLVRTQSVSLKNQTCSPNNNGGNSTDAWKNLEAKIFKCFMKKSPFLPQLILLDPSSNSIVLNEMTLEEYATQEYPNSAFSFEFEIENNNGLNKINELIETHENGHSVLMEEVPFRKYFRL